MESVRSCIYQAQLSLLFWAEVVQYIVYTLNRTSTRLLGNYILYEAYTGSIPSISHLRPFGCPIFIHIPKDLCKKLDPKAQPSIFLGYSQETKRYRIWIPNRKHVVTSRDITFDEDQFLYWNITPKASSSESTLTYLPISLTNTDSSTPTPSVPQNQNQDQNQSQNQNQN
jgi:hypothetical protein